MSNSWQVAGLPLHPLLVHAVVVLLPLTVIAVLLTQFWPTARRRLGIVTPVAALGVLVLVPVTVKAGQSLAKVVGPLPRVLTHQEYGQMLLPWVIALFVIAAFQWWWFRSGVRRYPPASSSLARVVPTALAVLSVVVGIGNLVLIVLIGDSGARAVWGGLLG
ncbi:MAG: hypothetical protein CVT68_11145 [Actinobacteria bacterium HGW-Actinobacteria-8]|nr:MAG: hypothetical protein CVT68_11145 [Actinobacteria bacterium HGW-Actinobacteria-8]